MAETKKTVNKKPAPKKPATKKAAPKKAPAKKVAAPKIDYKKKYEDEVKQTLILNSKIRELVFDNNKNISDFQEKAKGFSAKAQIELDKVKKHLNEKAEEDSKETKMYGSQKLLESIIGPITNIDIAVQAGKKQTDPGVNAYVQGFEMLLNQTYNAMSENGIEIIEPKVGDKFDPRLHMAISKNEGKDINIIAEVKKKGFKLHDRIIKPAGVIIGK